MSEKPNRRQWLRAAAGALCLPGIAACKRSSAAVSKVRPLRVGLDLWPGFDPILLAKARGKLAERALNVEFAPIPPWGVLNTEFVARNLEVIGVALGDVINIAQRDADVQIILVTDQSNGGDIIVGQVPFQGPESVRGKKIAVNVGYFGEVFIKEFLDRHQVKLSEVRLVNCEANRITDGLTTKLFAAGHTWEPFATQAMHAGFHSWFTSKEVFGLIPSCIAVHARVLAERRREVQGLVDAWFESIEWMKDHEDEARNLLAKVKGVLPAAVRYDGLALQDRAANRKLFAPGGGADTVAGVIEIYSRYFVERGTIDSASLRLVDPSIVMAAT